LIHREVRLRMATTSRPPRRVSRPPSPTPARSSQAAPPGSTPRRIASNFAFMSIAEIICRGTSVAVTLTLARRLGISTYGRVGFAFDVVFWLVLLVRDAFEVIISRELARHPRLIRPLVNHVLAIRGLLSLALFSSLLMVDWLTISTAADRAILALYGLLLLPTALL